MITVWVPEERGARARDRRALSAAAGGVPARLWRRHAGRAEEAGRAAERTSCTACTLALRRNSLVELRLREELGISRISVFALVLLIERGNRRVKVANLNSLLWSSSRAALGGAFGGGVELSSEDLRRRLSWAGTQAR